MNDSEAAPTPDLEFPIDPTFDSKPPVVSMDQYLALCELVRSMRMPDAKAPVREARRCYVPFEL